MSKNVLSKIFGPHVHIDLVKKKKKKNGRLNWLIIIFARLEPKTDDLGHFQANSQSYLSW